MKDLLTKAAKYTPDTLVDFIMSLHSELDLENKAVFRAILIEYFLSDTLTYEDDTEPKLSNKK